MTPVPVLLTCDIHTHMTGSAPVREDLIETRRILQGLGARCTFFFPAQSAEELPDQVAALRREGHEIGCHGLTQGATEHDRRLPLEAQRGCLTEATARLARVLGERPVSFRAPVFKLSAGTIGVLEELGYRADVSVPAQQLGLFGSDPYDVKPLFAPRRPYHPDRRDLFRPGDRSLWEIPVSAWGLPFLSDTERLCGLPAMRAFFRLLRLESRLTGKPVVFMFHPSDFNAARGIGPRRPLGWRDFLPSRTSGFRFRDALLERDARRIQQDLTALIQDMAAQPGVRMVTVRDYVAMLDQGGDGAVAARQNGRPAALSAGPPPAPAQAQPALTDKDILCISSIDWDFIWQGHQEIMATLAAQGNRVLFIENTGVRAPRFRDVPRLTHRLLNWLRSTKGFRKERERLFIYSPLLLPFPYSPLARRVNRWLLLRALQRWMRATACRRPILWTFLPTPLTLDLIRGLDPELTVYYWIDDLASSSPGAKRITRSETELIRAADLVFVTSEKLRQRAAGVNGDVHLFPFGVDFQKFEAVRNEAGDAPQDLQGLRRPVVGYIGGLHRWIDQELLAEVARRLPQVTFALIGPAQADVSRLLRCPNVRLLGARPHDDLPRYTKAFDVGIVPYRLSDYTAHVYPTKLNEYLAMGLPVVATGLPEIHRFNAIYGEIVAVAPDAAGFAAAIQDALAAQDPGQVSRRIAVARENSWSVRIAQMAGLIAQRLASRHAAGERWQESLRRLYRAARRRSVRLSVVLGAAYLLLFQSPLLWIVAEPLQVAAPPAAADAIVVFAGGVGESGKAGGGYQERVKQAVDLYRAGHAPRIVFSSGYTFIFQEALIMQELALGQGIPPAAILLETQATNTHENVTHVAAILEQRGWRSILLVSSPYHMRRALLTWRRAAPQVRVVPAPVAESRFFTHTHGATLEQIRGILHEYLGLAYYWCKGWI